MKREKLNRALSKLGAKSKMVQFRLRPEQYEQLLVKVEKQKMTVSKLFQAITDLYLRDKL